MFRVSSGLLLALFVGGVGTGALAHDDAKTIRVEPRAIYGATISLEAGVRVFRPLPRTTHIIINPSRSPLSISVGEESKTIRKSTHVK